MKLPVAIIGFLLVCCSFSSKAQSSGKSMKAIFEEASTIVDELFADGYEVVKVDIDELFTESKSVYVTVGNQWDYGFMVKPDYRIQEVVMEVYKASDKNDGSWEKVYSNQNERNKSFAFTTLEPMKAATYRIDLSATQFHKSYLMGHVCVIVFHE